MRRLMLAALLLIVGGSTTTQAGSMAAQSILVGSTWAVSLDAEGRVIDLAQTTYPKPVKPPIAEPLAKAIRGWTFEPGRIDGKPMPTETTLDLTVKLEPQASGDYAIRVSKASTGGAAIKRVPPYVPVDRLPWQNDSVAILVVVEARYDETGKVVSTQVAPGSPDVDQAFKNAFMKAVSQWKFQPERVAGHGVAAMTYLPICVTAQRMGRTSGRPRADCEKWTPPGEGDAVADDAVVAVKPVARLRSDVVGALL